ncbi:Cofilin [Golovinomyces cichoracearum]|uniref:Cofilin n=1 Tax=Golovinomyces cichoracearum TaxID=62708 RepID=A0A420IJ81_9PEZI|nr:Cofilin [Golovinomyces cichoracearum]
MFISWSPDTATVHAKMTYSTSKASLKLCLEGLSAELQANDKDDLEYENILNVVSKGQLKMAT